MQLNTAYKKLTSIRPCGPNKRAIRAATYDLAKKDDPCKEPFENLPENAFEGIADWEKKIIHDLIRALREAWVEKRNLDNSLFQVCFHMLHYKLSNFPTLISG